MLYRVMVHHLEEMACFGRPRLTFHESEAEEKASHHPDDGGGQRVPRGPRPPDDDDVYLDDSHSAADEAMTGEEWE